MNPSRHVALLASMAALAAAFHVALAQESAAVPLPPVDERAGTPSTVGTDADSDTDAKADSNATMPVVRTFDVPTEQGFTDYRAVVATWVGRQHRRGPAHVCLLGEDDASGGRWAWAIWREGGRIALWDGGDTTLEASRRSLDLRRDVVATDDDLHGSSARVTRAWVADLRARCASAGTTFVLTRADLAAPAPRVR